jgi:hypothetical protein
METDVTVGIGCVTPQVATRFDADGVQRQFIGRPVQPIATFTTGAYEKHCGNHQGAEQQQKKSSLHIRKLLYSYAKLHFIIDISPFSSRK